MNNFKLTMLVIGFALSFNACSSDSNSTEEKMFVSSCSDDNSTFTELASGATLKSENSDTTIKMTHNENGTKYVCTLSGKAYIE